MMRTMTLVAAAAAAAALPNVPSFPLYNAAVPGLTIPAVGLGTGGYSNTPSGYGVYPECWAATANATCAGYVNQAVQSWLNIGGRRIDSADSYQCQATVGAAMAASGVARSEVFFLSKTGPSQPLGFNDTLQQFAQVLSDVGTTYVDALLVHWPWVHPPNNQSSDPACNASSGVFSERDCRISTWKAYVQIFNSGAALSIGVSNYNSSHLQEIVDAGLPLPAINQIPFHAYRSSSQSDTVSFCKAHNITVVGYSPLGVPDWHVFPAGNGMSPTQLRDPVVVSIAAAHGRSPAQVLLAWQYALGIPVNPRSQNVAHMVENLNYFDIQLTAAEIQALSNLPQATCAIDPNFYECAP